MIRFFSLLFTLYNFYCSLFKFSDSLLGIFHSAVELTYWNFYLLLFFCWLYFISSMSLLRLSIFFWDFLISFSCFKYVCSYSLEHIYDDFFKSGSDNFNNCYISVGICLLYFLFQQKLGIMSIILQFSIFYLSLRFWQVSFVTVLVGLMRYCLLSARWR